MTDLDKLIAEARRLENDYGDAYEVMSHMSALADALEARQPSERADAHPPSVEQIAEVLDAHRLIEGSDFAGRLNGDWWCACRWRESRSGHLAHQAEAVRALFGEVAGDE